MNLIKARVVNVIDGDSFEIFADGAVTEIRMSAIDCPEKDQPWGDRATSGLIKLIQGQFVYLQTYGLDVYNRTLATVYAKHYAAMININAKMVRMGHAWAAPAHSRHLSSTYRSYMLQIEEWARSNQIGLWSTENPLPPWQWRHNKI